MEQLKRWLAARHLGVWLAALCLPLLAPALWGGLVLDDLSQRRVLLDGLSLEGQPTSPLDLFTFFSGDPAARAALLESGVWPWWTSDDLAIRFFRPVAALTHIADYQSWPNWPALMHLHSLLWYGALVLVATALYRRLLDSARVAGYAALLYALCDAHAMPAAWLANRGALIASVFALLTLWLHDRGRRDGARLAAWLAPLSLLLALGAGEIAVGVLALLLSHAVFLDEGTIAKRALRLLPYAAVVLLWRIAYRSLGYGSSGSGIYTDPLGEPVRFLQQLPARGAVLAFSQLVAPVADGWPFMPTTAGLLFASFAAVVVALLVWFWRRHACGERSARFFAFGGALALVPCCAVVPSDRVLLLSSFASAGFIASWLAASWGRDRSRLIVVVGGWMLVRHAMLPLVLMPVRAHAPRMFGDAVERAVASAPSDPQVTKQTLVVVNTPHLFFSALLGPWRRWEGRPAPAKVRCLGATVYAVSLRREDERTLVLSVAEGYLDKPADQIAWSPRHDRGAGYRRVLSDMTVEVIGQTPDGRPREVRFRFAEPLENQRWRFVAWQGSGYAELTLPARGSELLLEPISAAALR